jgi:hypothetical protein
MIIPNAIAAVPAPSKPATQNAVSGGYIGGSAPYHPPSSPSLDSVLWTPGNTGGLNGSNPASYNNGGVGYSTVIPYAIYRSRGWRLQCRLVANVTQAGSRGPSFHLLSDSDAWISALISSGPAGTFADGTYNWTSPWVDVTPSSALATIQVRAQTTRVDPANNTSNLTWNSSTLEFQWVNP